VLKQDRMQQLIPRLLFGFCFWMISKGVQKKSGFRLI